MNPAVPGPGGGRGHRPGGGGGHGPGASRTGTPGDTGLASVTDDLRAFLASATGRDEMLHLPPGTALFGEAVGLDSLTGTLLLREVERRFGVDVAGEDLNLDSLATLGTLAAFVAQRARPGAAP